jgi:hypothetical protein
MYMYKYVCVQKIVMFALPLLNESEDYFRIWETYLLLILSK